MTAISRPGRGRARRKPCDSEDAPLSGGATPAVEETPMVRRARWRGATTSKHPPMFLLGPIYVTLMRPTGAFIYFSFPARTHAHTITFLRAIQPLRTIFFTLGAV